MLALVLWKATLRGLTAVPPSTVTLNAPGAGAVPVVSRSSSKTMWMMLPSADTCAEDCCEFTCWFSSAGSAAWVSTASTPLWSPVVPVMAPPLSFSAPMATAMPSRSSSSATTG